MGTTEQIDIVKTIKAMHKERDYHGILALVKDMKTEKLKDRRVLEMIADAYNKSGLYKEAREHLLMAYEHYPQSRSLAYKLVIISIKLDNLDDAVDFYEAFCSIAPGDNNRFILKYLIGRAGGIEVKDLIRVLEQYNERESDERWLYELARLYHEAGRIDDCVKVCDEIALWYADGEYEKAALELKFMHKALSPAQQERYEKIMRAFVEKEEDEAQKAKEEEERLKLEREAESFVSEFSGLSAFPKKEAEESEPEEATQKIFTKEEITEAIKEEAEEKADQEQPPEESAPGEAAETEIPSYKIENETEEEESAQEDEEAQTAADEDEEESTQEAPINETFRLPVDKINEILGNAPVDDERNITFRLPVDIINEILKESEQEDSTKSITDILTDAVQEVQVVPAQPPKHEEHAAKEAPKPEIRENLAIFSDRGYSKIGASVLSISPAAYLVSKPSLNRKTGFIEEPVLRDNVDISDIPLDKEADGQIGINLNLLAAEKEQEDDSQITIDEFFRQYAGRVEENREAVAAVEAERLRQIIESVKDMEARPLYDMEFNTPEQEAFSEEEIIRIVPDDEIPDEAVVVKTRELTEEDLLSEVSLEEEEAKETASETESGEEKAQEENKEEISEEETAAAEEETAEAETEKETVPAPEEPSEKPEEAVKTEEETPAEAAEEIKEEAKEAQEETENTQEAAAAAGEAQGAEEPEKEADTAKETETAKEAAVSQQQSETDEEVHTVKEAAVSEEAAPEENKEENKEEASEENAGEGAEEEPEEEEHLVGWELEETPEKESENEETGQEAAEENTAQKDAEEETDKEAAKETEAAGLEAALAKFEQEKETAQLNSEDTEALYGFGDTLAELVAGKGEQPEEAEEKEFVISDSFRKELKEFLLIEGLEEEIRQACETISNKKRAGDETGGNLIITGDKKCGKTYLAISMIKAVIKEVGTGSGKVVKVQAQPLNGKNFRAVLKKVEGRDLIIENVGYLKDETIRNIIEVVKSGEFGHMIVLEGNMLAIENIIAHFPEIEELFGSRINIHELTITQWADIARKYAKEQGYIIDDMANLALHARIDKINVPTARLGLGDIKDIVDSAIAKASRRNNGKLFAAFSRKGKEEIALTESDFTE